MFLQTDEVGGAGFGIERHWFAIDDWLMFLLAALELAISIWMIRLGPKRTIAYLLPVMQVSVLGSLAFHMLCLA